MHRYQLRTTLAKMAFSIAEPAKKRRRSVFRKDFGSRAARTSILASVPARGHAVRGKNAKTKPGGMNRRWNGSGDAALRIAANMK